jgi:cob(I)alamin adenosyltransferase
VACELDYLVTVAGQLWIFTRFPEVLWEDTTVKEMERVESRVLINTGHGKGKSSAAFGVMSRAWARGWRVIVVQFVKSGKWKVGEKKLADHLEIEWHALGDGFTWESEDLVESERLGQHAWEVAKAKLVSGEYDMVILDEITYAINYGWIPLDDVRETLLNRAKKTNVVLTGRDAPEALIEVADTVTEMRKIKHAYDLGIRAKKGIEY